MDNALRFGLLVVVLVLAAVWDVRTGRVPNWLTFPAMAAGLVLAAALGWLAVDSGLAGASGALQGLGRSAFGLACGLVPFAIIFYSGALGGGDVKLMAAVGAISASWECVLGTAFYGFVAAGILGLVMMVRLGVVRQTLRRLGAAVMMAAARVKPELDAHTPRVPLALAFCVGGLLAGAEQLLGVPLPWSG